MASAFLYEPGVVAEEKLPPKNPISQRMSRKKQIKAAETKMMREIDAIMNATPIVILMMTTEVSVTGNMMILKNMTVIQT